MSSDDTGPNWKVRIALFAAVAVAGGLWLFNQAIRDSETPTPATAVATSCSRFEVDAQKLFDNGNTAALSGTFARGDHVKLSIDINGVGYSWELTGVLAKKPDVSGSGWFSSVTRSVTTKSSSGESTTSGRSTYTTSTVSRGEVSGLARLDLEIDVSTAGPGAVIVNKTGSVPSFVAAKVISASCNASTQANPVAEEAGQRLGSTEHVETTWRWEKKRGPSRFARVRPPEE
jgi:hypothetical protein